MLAITTPYLWYTSRATGMVAMILFTLVVTLGTFVANRIGGTIVGRFEINELHRSLSIVAIVFLGLHILTTVVDSYVSTGLISAFIPMTSSYKRVPVALGAVAFDLILAVWVSSLLKLRIKNQTWRFIHWFSWLGVTTSLVHGFLTGSDARHGFGLILVGLCTLAVVSAALWRFLGRPARAAGRTALSPLAAAPAPRLNPKLTPSGPRRPGVPTSSGPFPRNPRPPQSKARR